MNKLLVFIGGLVTGVVLTLVILLVFYASEHTDSKTTEANNTEIGKEKNDNDGITFFKEPGDIIEVESFKVFQVLADNAALVMGESGHGTHYGTVYAIFNRDGKYYYDDEIIKVPKGKVVRQMGIYQYPTKDEIMKTVPIIMIMDN